MSETKETKKPDTAKADISFEVGFKGEKTRFDLNFISVAAEQELQMQFNDLSDNEESQKKNLRYARKH